MTSFGKIGKYLIYIHTKLAVYSMFYKNTILVVFL